MAIPKYDLDAQCLESGRFVVVFVDVVTRRRPEGVAELVELCALGEEAGYERWIVRFVNDGGSAVRMVHQVDLVSLPALPVPTPELLKGGCHAN